MHAPSEYDTLKRGLDALYDGFNRPDSARDPVEIVRRYPRLEDREIVAFIAAALAFGRVASIMASIEAVCGVLGPHPAERVRRFDPAADGAPLRPLVHRWTRGDDFVALIWILRQLIDRHGSLEAAFAGTAALGDTHVGDALERFAAEARAIDLRPAYGRRPRQPGVYYFFARPSTGGACKRMNLFLRWMVRHDAVDPGGWTAIRPAQLIVPLDTHTIRMGQRLGLTSRKSPGWRMALDITESLRRFDADDPVRYDFSLCHLSMISGRPRCVTDGEGDGEGVDEGVVRLFHRFRPDGARGIASPPGTVPRQSVEKSYDPLAGGDAVSRRSSAAGKRRASRRPSGRR